MHDRLFPCLVRLACLGLLIAALAAGMTPRPVPSGMDQQLAAWQAAGLSLGDICADHGAADDHDRHCPLCTLAGAPGLPPVSAHRTEAERRILARIVLPQMRRAAGHARDPAIPKRGPPRPI